MNIASIKPYIPDGAAVELNGNRATFEVSAKHLVEVANSLYQNENLQLLTITATDERHAGGGYIIWYVFGAPKEHAVIIPYLVLKNTEEFPSLSLIIHEAWNYERQIRTFFGLIPVGHPDPRPINLHENWPADVFPLRKDVDWKIRPEIAHGSYQFQVVEGEGIYEIPVGPIHAGIIEPGHFRFSVAGEEIVLLEPKLGYTHKGSEKLFEQLPLNDKVKLSEKISGDSSFSHSLAFCQAAEQLADVTVPTRALYLRTIYAELERLANHFGDIGAMMLDTGYSFGGAHGARLREMVMQINGRLSGSRFLRGVNALGGVTKDIEDGISLSADLEKIKKDFSEVLAIAEDCSSLVNRLQDTGVLTPSNAAEHGLTGMAARAVGIVTDARIDYPYAAYKDVPLHVIETELAGDAQARFHVRTKEVIASMDIVQRALREMPQGPIIATTDITFKENAIAVSIVEGWRGEIVYFLETDKHGTISRVAPRDPSFINWSAVGGAGVGNMVPDFPLINKSFNLSYTGYDL